MLNSFKSTPKNYYLLLLLQNFLNTKLYKDNIKQIWKNKKFAWN